MKLYIIEKIPTYLAKGPYFSASHRLVCMTLCSDPLYRDAAGRNSWGLL